MGLGASKQPPKGVSVPVPSANPIQPDGSLPNNTPPAIIDIAKPKPTPPTQIRNPNARHHRTPSQPIAMPISPDVDRGISIAVSPSNGFVPTGVDLIPTVFTWAHGGKQVAVTGTWCGWKEVAPLKRSTSDFATILELPPGVHQYKFIVDGKWTHAPDQPVATDTDGNLNNYMDVKEFRLETKSVLEKSTPPGSYSQDVPAMFLAVADGGPTENPFLPSPSPSPSAVTYSSTPPVGGPPNPYYYSHTPTPKHGFGVSPSSSPAPKDTFKPSTSAPVSHPPPSSTTPSRERSKRPVGPPTLPPHLLRSRAVLNTEAEEDPTVLPLPNHVMLNHLYQRDYDGNDEMKDVMILGSTVRYRDKFVTTVFYRPKPKAQNKRSDEDGDGDEESEGGERDRLFAGEKEDILLMEDDKKETTSTSTTSTPTTTSPREGGRIIAGDHRLEGGGGGDKKEMAV